MTRWILAALCLGLGLGGFWLGRRPRIDSVEIPTIRPQRTEPYPEIASDRPRNVVLMIADGMGFGHMAVTRLLHYGKEGQLQMERLPVTAFVSTLSGDDVVVDSAAAATAQATGRGVPNGVVSTGANSEPLKTIMESARDVGYRTGLITTTYLTDATPAAFAAHVPARRQQDEIALQLVTARIDLLVGDLAHFFPKGDRRSQRKDASDLIAAAERKGYTFIDTRQAWLANRDLPVIAHFPHVSAPVGRAPVEFDPSSPTLVQLTAGALVRLREANEPFFLLVEEEGVDTGAHLNDYRYVAEHLRRFDDAVEVASRDAADFGDTLVVVTSDHETGGLSFTGRSGRINIHWSTTGHTGQHVPLLAFGPGARRLSGSLRQTDINRLLMLLLDL